MKRSRLSGTRGAGLDPCAAIQVPFELDHGLDREIIFTLGAGKNMDLAVETVRQFRGSEAAKRSLDKVQRFGQRPLAPFKLKRQIPH